MDLVSPLLCHNREEIEQHQEGKEKHQKRLLCKAFLVKVDGGLIWIDIKYRADAQPQRYSDNIKEEPYLCQKITTGTKYSTHARCIQKASSKSYKLVSWMLKMWAL